MNISLCTLCAAILVSPVFAAKPSQISNLPPAVQQRIKNYNAEGELKKITPRKQKDGTTVYEVEFKERGNTEQLVIAPDGTILSETAGKGKSQALGQANRKQQDKNSKDSRDRDDGSDNKSTSERKRSEPNAQATTTPSSPPNTPQARVIRPDSPSGAETAAGTVTTSSVRIDTSVRPGDKAPRPALDRRPGETRYIYWDSLPEPVRRMGLAQQAELGTVNARLLRVQKKTGKTLYHIPYEKGTISIDEGGIVISNATEHGGPMMLIKWDDLPEPVKKNALAAGEVNANTVTYQTKDSRTLYHVLYAKETVNSYSQDGNLQDPATYWR
jgi:hypothetical protein